MVAYGVWIFFFGCMGLVWVFRKIGMGFSGGWYVSLCRRRKKAGVVRVTA